MESQIQEIKNLVSQNRTSDAISILLQITQKNKGIHDSILILSSKFTELTMQKIRGTISNDEAIRLQNQVNEKILEALNIFDKKGNILPGLIAPNKNSAVAILTKITVGFVVSMAPAALFDKFTGLDLGLAWGALFLAFITFVGLVIALVLSALR